MTIKRLCRVICIGSIEGIGSPLMKDQMDQQMENEIDTYFRVCRDV